MTRHPPLRSVKIFCGENWISFLTPFSDLSVLFRNTFKKVSSQMQVHSLSHTDWRLHTKYSWSIAILFQFIFCGGRKKQILFAACSWCNIFFGYFQEVLRVLFFAAFFGHGRVRGSHKKSHGIYFVKFYGHPEWKTLQFSVFLRKTHIWKNYGSQFIGQNALVQSGCRIL